MAVREILKFGNETLRKTCHPVQKFDLRLRLLLRDMADTMYEAEGVGLAAPQVGILRRAVVIDVQDDHGLIELVNPVIISAEGEQAKWERHQSVWAALYDGLEKLGFRMAIKKEYQSRLVISVLCPDDPAFDFGAMHDYLYKYGYTIYSGKVAGVPMFRMCALGALTAADIPGVFDCIRDYMKEAGMAIPCRYN